MAKELCMIENNEKGKKARKYFMDVEVAFKQQRISQPELSPTEWLMETAKQIHLQGQRLIIVEQELALQKKQAEEAKLKALALPGPSVSLKAETTRQLLNERINYYVASTHGKVKWDQAWKILYTKAVYRLSMHFNMFEKKIDQVEKKGKLDLLYALACEIFPLEEVEYKNIQETINEDNRE